MAEKQYVQPEDHLGNTFVFPSEAKVVKMEDGTTVEETIRSIKQAQTDAAQSLEDVVQDMEDMSLSMESSKSKTYQMTMAAAGWTGDAAPYSIDLTVEGVTATNNVDIIPQASTEDQIDAWLGLGYMLGSQTEGKVTIKSWGDKPAVDIPITVIVRGD